MRKLLTAFVLLILLALVGISFPASAQDRETRTVGAYDIIISWRIEPAYVGVFNGPEFQVKAHDGGAAVTGLETSLHMLTHLGDQQKLLQIYPVTGDPGDYTADLIPTRPGDYTFHLFGKINDQDVDEMFTSADGFFDSVNPETDIMFPSLDNSDNGGADATEAVTPEATDETASLQAQIDELRDEITQLKAGKSS